MNIQEKILNQIKSNRLSDASYDFLVKQLCVLNNKSWDDMRDIVDGMIATGQITVHGAKPIKKAKLVDPKAKDKKGVQNYVKKGKKDRKRIRKELTDEYIGDDMVEDAYRMLAQKDKRAKVVKVTGRLQGTSKGFAFLIPDDPNISDIFIPQKAMKTAINNDRVVVETRLTNSRPEGKVLQVIERGNDNIVGKIFFTKSGAYVTPDDVKFGKDIYVPLSKINGASNGYKVVVAIERYYDSKRNPDGRVVEVLGEPNAIETEALAVIRSYKLYENFPKKVLEFAENMPDHIDKTKYPNRLDFTKEICFTIDGADSRDLDDAVSLTKNKAGHWVLGVHIADVGEYVPRNSIIDKEAYKRATSVYFPQLVLPMLPRQLSNGICSLNERVDRLALSVFIEYDENFKEVGHKICESIINSKKRFTYDEVFAIFNGNQDVIEKNKPFVEMLNNMNMLAKHLMKERIKAGYIEFDIPEVKISLNDLGDVLYVEPRENNDSHKLIEAFMVATNEVVAKEYCLKKLPFVYRVHETPDSEKVETFNNYVSSLGITSPILADAVTPTQFQKLLKEVGETDYKYVVNRVCLRTMRKAKYMPDCLGHFGLALKYYCHFTSPIRRYPDLTIHRIIKDDLNRRINGAKLQELKQFVLESSIQSSEREVLAEKVERDIDDLYRVFYMRNHLDEEWEGVISGVTAFGVFVELQNTVEGLVRLEDLPMDKYEYIEERFLLKGNRNTFALGDKVKVKCVGANILTREVDFVLL